MVRMDKEDFKNNIFSLSERIYPMVARMLGNQVNVEDAIQEIMMKLWLKRKEIQGHPNIQGFVIKTARNHCIDILRKKKHSLHLDVFDRKLSQFLEEDTRIEWKELLEVLDDIYLSMPENQREVFVMKDIDGYSYEEIAAALDISIDYARVLLSRARKHISLELETKYSYEKGRY